MNIHLPSNRLMALIRKFGSEALEARQIARRLGDLLPLRFHELRREHARRKPGAASERQAFADERYQAYVDEYCDVAYTSLKTRIEYDTHMMLFHARQSIQRHSRKNSPSRSHHSPPPIDFS